MSAWEARNRSVHAVVVGGVWRWGPAGSSRREMRQELVAHLNDYLRLWLEKWEMLR